MNEPRWISKDALLILHDRSIALHGGASGVRDDVLLELALQRPINRFHYEEIDDLHVLGATYVVGVAANHPFVDGNKRAAFLAGGLFLLLNGLQLIAEQADAALTVLGVAAGSRDVDQLADWMRARTVRR
ncbi:type II toxin-antitoxin system death-on-curing family toxin [Phenylobacterium sp.]|uniref:type II toxin-antitoxin system death-on-curing family toxin n=1 Tax=Phenylobacterium sp. TaxID=1871053 RepID=UPI0035B1C832